MKQIGKLFLPLAIAATVMSCGESDTSSSSDTTVQNPTPVVATISDVQVLRPNIDYMPWDGSLNDAIYWKDARGENAIVISSKPQYFWAEENPKAKSYFPKGEDEETLSELTEIFATHWVLKAGESKWKQYNLYHDFLFGCCDVFMEYQAGSLQVMDADSNGVGEAMFMYNQTEGDGIIGQTFLGTMVLELDSAYYTIKDETGLGIQKMKEEDPKYQSSARKAMYPQNERYTSVMNAKWEELYKAKVELDRAQITERNNVDEQGHEDHHH